MSTGTLTMRIDNDLKRDASEVAEYYGFDLSSITRAFYKQIVRDHAIPLDLGYSNETPNEQTLKAFKEAEYAIKHPEKFPSYSSAEDMIKAILESDG